jgi:glucose/arabinose dehydrogenase
VLRPSARRSALLLAVALLAGCTNSADSSDAQPTSGQPSLPATTGSGSGATTPTRTAPPEPSVTGTVASRLDVPWGVALLSDGSALVAERDSGRVVRVRAGSVTPVGTVPGVEHTGESGLLGLAVRPGDDSVVFAYFTAASDNRVVRIPFDGSRLGTPRPILTGIPKAGRHDGGRLVIGPDGNLWIGTGDAGETANAQDRASLGGKILRITPDGRVPAGNPFPGSPVWSYGHRNVQGLAFDSTGQLWATEFGQNTWDELNRVVKGGNFGWPLIEGRGERAGFVDPQVVWSTDEASPSGLAIVDDVAYVAALRGERLWQVPVAGGRAGRPRAWFTGDYGRLRTVLATPAGRLWLTTSNRDGRGAPASADDRILELTLTLG